MPSLLSDQTAIVTGAASGIGRAIARTFAENGADVVVADIQESPREGGRPTHEVIDAETDASATYVECDVSVMDDLEAMVEAADAYGGVDVLVNNAAIFRTEEFLDVTPEAFDQLLDVNVRGVFFASQLAAEVMVDAGGGCIINVSSIAGLLGNADYVTYSTAKGAIRTMTYSLADRLGPEGIRVNAIHPGGVETAMLDDAGMDTEAREAFVNAIPSRRFGTGSDIAGAALFLASDLAGYVNGESLVVDGGYAHTG